MFFVSGFHSLNPLEPPPADCTPRRPELKAFVSSPWSPTKVEPNQHEEKHKFTYTWIVRSRPDTFFRVPIRPPPISDVLGGFYCKNNDAFFVTSTTAAPGLFNVWDLALKSCDWVGNSTLSRSLPTQYQCGLQVKNIYADCIFRLSAYRHRLIHLGCERILSTNGRDFFRAYYCAHSSCVSKGWTTRSPSVYFPVSVNETASDHGNLILDDDIYEWGVFSGAILKNETRI